MWNLYEIEKRFEAHVKEVDERSRKAHLHTNERNRLRPRAVIRWLSLAVVIIFGYFVLK